MTEPRLAATSVLVREGQVLMLRRSASMAFARGMHVFPGGSVEQIDYAETERETLRRCARRETLEEVGIDAGQGLVYFDRWVTPEFEPMRFDVGFFIAATHESGELLTTEAEELRWIAPAEALAAAERGEFPVLRPTWETLKRVHTFLAQGIDLGALVDEEVVVPRLPRKNSQGSWDIVHATTGEILEANVHGPQLSEATGLKVSL